MEFVKGCSGFKFSISHRIKYQNAEEKNLSQEGIDRKKNLQFDHKCTNQQQ